MCQSYLEDEHYNSTLSNIEDDWEHPLRCSSTLELILDCMFDFNYREERDEVIDEIEFLQSIIIYKNQTEE